MYLPTNNFNKDINPQNRSNYYFFEKEISDDEISSIEKLSLDYKFNKGRTGQVQLDDDSIQQTNNRDIAYIDDNNDSHWIYQRLWNLINIANTHYYGFDIDFPTDHLHYVIYPEDGGHLDWHMDIGPGCNNRKLALTVQLSDYSSYEGGDFQIWIGGDGFVNLPRHKGDVVIFPTYLMHRVTPIISGQRKCLVFWAGGSKSFR